MTKFNFTTEKKAAYNVVTVMATGKTIVHYFSNWEDLNNYVVFWRNTPAKNIVHRFDGNTWVKLDMYFV